MHFFMYICCVVICLFNIVVLHGDEIQVEQTMCIIANINVAETPIQELITFMKIAPSDEVRKIFTEMSLKTKILFLKEMNIHDYATFLDAFNEQNWWNMWQQLSPESQSYIPRTKSEQYKMILETWQEFAKYNCNRGNHDEFKRYIACRDAALKNLFAPRERMRSESSKVMEKTKQIAKEELENSFIKRKLRMFNIID